MKKYLLVILSVLYCILNSWAQPSSKVTTKSNVPQTSTINWQKSPFDHQVFIDNEGQFDAHLKSGEKILYGVHMGEAFAFITNYGIIYKYTEYTKAHVKNDKEKSDPDAGPAPKKVDHYLTATWEGGSSNMTVVAGEEQTYYYSYPTASGKGTIIAHAFKTLTCKNVYPGIDIEYTFPKDKGGIEYALVVHPGADLSLVKLKYKGAKTMFVDSAGNIEINGGWGLFTDHAPIASYQEDNQATASSYKLTNTEESFNVPNLDNTKTLIIDPYVTNWSTNITNANLGGYDGAYDVDWDYAGNVYVYGGETTFEEVKYNSAGVLQWVYPSSNFTTNSQGYYGCFCVSKTTGVSFLFESFGGAGGAETDKISPSAVSLGTNAGNVNMDEQWRASYDLCDGVIVIAGGGSDATGSNQAAVLDTTFTTFTTADVMGIPTTDYFHDMALLASDPILDVCYMATTHSSSTTSGGVEDNYLLKLPLPGLTPATFNVADNYAFDEVNSITYIPGTTFGVNIYANAMNGMAVSPNWVYMYDGKTLKQVSKTTGALNATVALANNQYKCGGLAVDLCDNIYVGSGTSVDVYDVALAHTGTIGPFTGEVFDVSLSRGRDSLYVCGKGFVSTVSLNNPTSETIAKVVTPAGCTCNGAVSATLEFCGTPYTSGVSYKWSSGQTTSSITGLCSGTIDTITITVGCLIKIKDTVLITGTTGALTISTTETNLTCTTLGTATVTETGGTAPFTYAWTPGAQSTATATGLTAGTYTITLSSGGCSQTATAVITQPATMTATMGAPTDPTTCNGTGSATVTVTGGTLPYTYAWTTLGGTGATGTGLDAGTFTVTVTSTGGCTATADVTITSPASVTATTGFTAASCNLPNGSATVNPAGGTAPYTYDWTPSGETTQTATGLVAGTYTVVVTANSGCSTTTTVTVTQPTTVTATMGAPTNPLCNGETGSATVTATGGFLPYTYAWTGGGGAAATANITAGTYTVTVTTNNGCVSTASVAITQPALLTAAMGVPIYPLCNGENGSATVTATGGTLPYTYAWTGGGGAAATATLSAGNYTVTVTDNNECTSSATVVITQPALLTATMGAPTDPACSGGTGSATVTVTGGTLPYAYNWTLTGGNAATANSLIAGGYTVTITDHNGCTSTATVTITQPTALGTTTSFTPASCNLFNGSATVTVTGGTTPYAYLWNPTPQTTATAAGVSAGTYSVTVTDANGCTTTATVTVTQPSAVTASIISSTSISCFGGDNGTATAGANGGTGPYGYSWSGPGGDAATGTGFSVGTYTVTVHDINGCISTASVTITQPTMLAVNITGPGLICAGSTATLIANVTGGTLPYAFTWSGVGSAGSATNTDAITPPASEIYTVVITDANGCTATAEFTTTPGPPITVTTSGASICPGGTATICANASGGTGGGDMFTWQPGNLSSPCITVNPNTTTVYTVTVQDNCGTITTGTATVQMNPYPSVNFYADLYQGCAPLCVQFYNTTTLSAGTAESYSWLFGNGDSSHVSNPTYCYPTSGIYNVSLTVLSDSGCSATLKKSQMITVYGNPVAAFSMSPQPTTILNPTIQFTNQSTGLYPISYWFWSFGDGTIDSVSNIDQNPTHTYGDTGTYCAKLVVEDEHGCVDTTTNCLVIDPIFTLYIPSAFTPNGGGLNELFTAKGEYVKTFEMYIFDRWGEQLYHTTDINAGWNGTVKGGSTTSQEDVYVYKIIATDMENNQHSYIGSVTLIK